MKRIKKVMYHRMYLFEANGYALMGFAALILYGVVSLVIDFIALL